MLVDAKEFDSKISNHVVVKDPKSGVKVIAYSEFGSVSTTRTQGYRTAFAYFKEMSRGNIKLETVKEKVGIIVNCGQSRLLRFPRT